MGVPVPSSSNPTGRSRRVVDDTAGITAGWNSSAACGGGPLLVRGSDGQIGAGGGGPLAGLPGSK